MRKNPETHDKFKILTNAFTKSCLIIPEWKRFMSVAKDILQTKKYMFLKGGQKLDTWL